MPAPTMIDRSSDNRLRVECLPSDKLPMGVADMIRSFSAKHGVGGAHATPEVLNALCRGLGHRGYWLYAERDNHLEAVLPLLYQSTLLFGRYLTSLPYLNWGGLIAQAPDDSGTCGMLVDRAITLADELKVKHLELRHEVVLPHPRLTPVAANKCQMRMPLSQDPQQVFSRCRSTVRTQVRKGNKQDFEILFGGPELLDGYYEVFAINMRDLGTPVFPKRLFLEFVTQMESIAELCVVLKDNKPIACAMVFHHPNGLTEVPSASALRVARHTAVNTWMYWQLIERAIQRGASEFDFGRSTPDGPTFDFKRKWGAEPSEVAWQRYVREEGGELRPDNPKYSRAIEAWKKLPVWITRLAGPTIVRGIP